MKRILLHIMLGILSATLITAAVFYFFLFANPFNIHETNMLKWIPILIVLLSMYTSGMINKDTNKIGLPFLFIPFILFQPFNYAYFPFIIVLFVTGILSLMITRANQKKIYKYLACLGLGGIFIFHLLSQPLIIQLPQFGYDDLGNYKNAQIIWDFSSSKKLMLPKHHLLNANNEKISLEEFKGTNYFITFWATWCAPCMEEKEDLAQLKQQFAGHSDIQFVDVSFDVEVDKWKAYLKENAPQGLQLIAEDQKTTSRKLNFAGIPMHLIVDKNGQFVKISNFDAARNAILKMMVGGSISN